MKNIKLLVIFLTIFIAFQTNAANRYWVSDTTGNWNEPLNWATNNNGTPGAPVPTTGDRVYFNANGTGNCNLDVNVGIDGFVSTGYTGEIDLKGFSFNPATSGTAAVTFSGGTFNNTGLATNISTTTTGEVIFTGATTTFNIPINVIAGRVKFNGGVFNQPVIVEDNGQHSTNGNGGCTFNATLKVTNSGTSYFLMGYTNPDIFNGDVTLINTSTSRIRLAYNSANNQFNGNINISSSNGSGIWIGENGGSATFAATKVISEFGTGFTKGELKLKNFSQNIATNQSLTLSGTALISLSNSTFAGNVNYSSPRIIISESTFGGTSTFTKTGATDDYSTGGNVFNGEVAITNTGSGSLIMENGDGDTFNGNVTLNNLGTKDMYLARSNGHTVINGDLTISNNSSGSAGNILICDNTTASLTVTGNVLVNNNSSATNNTIELGDDGNFDIGGNLVANNNGSGSSNIITIANDPSCEMTIAGTTTVNNNGTGTTSRMYLGNHGSIQFDGDLEINNNSTVQNSEVYLNHRLTSNNIYYQNITLTSSTITTDGVRFGHEGGTGTLADNKTISIGAAGFKGGYLNLYNFTQTGATTQTITTTQNSLVYLKNSSFGGNASFTSPRINLNGNTFSGTSLFHKTGATDDASHGGNHFTGNCEIKNSGTGYFLTGINAGDIFGANLLLNNIGSKHIYIAHRSPGNTIAGTLTINNNSSATATTDVHIASDSAGSITINGETTLNNIGSSTTGNIYFGRVGDVTLNNDLVINNNTTGANGQVIVANYTQSSVEISGTTSVTNNGSGTTKRVYLGNHGDITFQNNLTLTNNSNATNSEIYLNHETNSTNQYNGDINLSSNAAGCDGIKFGDRNGNGTLAISKNISIGTSFISGYLTFRNFTKLSTNALSLLTTGTTYTLINDSEFNGNFSIQSPRLNLKNSTFSGTSLIHKTGPSDDASYGGNVFTGNSEIKNSGTGYFLTGQYAPDSFGGNLLINNIGSKHIYIAHRSPGNTIAGALTVNNNSNSANTTNVYIATDSAGAISINGPTILNNIGSSTSGNIYFGNTGDVILNNNLVINNSATGASGQTFIANSTNSTVNISGTTSVTNNGAGSSKKVYLGNNGDVNFQSDLTIVNNSDATYSEVILNHESNSSNTYQGNISISTTIAGSDGIRFGERNGSGILAATKSLSIGSTFVSGYLTFNNFTQLGSEPTSLPTTGTTYSIIKESQFGGDFSIESPRLYLKNNSFSGNANFEKTGGLGDDYSYGGNTIGGITTITNSGSKTFSFGSNDKDIFNGDVTISNTGTSRVLFAKSSVGNEVNGNLTINHAATGTGSNYLYVAETSIATLSITGNATLNNSGTSTQSYIEFGVSGDITLGGNLNIENNGSGTHSAVTIAKNSNSKVIVNGNTNANNSNNASRLNRLFFGYDGDIDFNGTIQLTNNAGSLESEVFFHHRPTASINFNGDVTLSSNHISSDGYYFGQSGGTGTLNNSNKISILANSPANFIGGDLRFSNLTYLGVLAHNFELNSSARYVYNSNCTWGGNTTFIAPRIYTKNSTFFGASYFEKTGKEHDDSYGGNSFAGNVTYIHNNKVASGRTYIGSSSANTYNGDLTVKNIGDFSEVLIGNAAGTYSVAGDVNLYNTSTGTESQHLYLGNNNASIFNISGNLNVYNNSPSAFKDHNIYISNKGEVNVTGSTTIENTGASGHIKYVYLGNTGNVTLGDDLTITNSSSSNNALVSVGYGSTSTVTINGNTTVLNSGAGNQKRIYFGDYGDVVFNGNVTATNNSSSSNSEIFFNYRTGSVSQFNGNVIVSSNHTNCDGFFFGSAGGTANLASPKQITILGSDPANFIGGDLRFYNFTYLGTIAHNFELSPSAKYAFNSNSTWGGNASFIAPRIYTKNSTFSGTTLFEKTGKDNDDSYGGNTFSGNVTYIHNNNIASGRTYVASSSPNLYNGDLTIKNTGAFSEILLGNSAGTYTIGGDVKLYNSSTGANNQHLYFGNNSSGTINVLGDLNVYNNSSSTLKDHNIYISNKGTVNVSGTTTIENTGNLGHVKYIYLGNSGDVNLDGDLSIINSSTSNNAIVSVAYGSSSLVTINGNTSVTNSGTGNQKRVYFGDYGDVTFNGDITATNNSSSSNSEIFFNYRTGSATLFNGNIALTSNHTSCDGYLFGSGGGTATLASSKTISIPGGVANFKGGQIHLRNFNQLGSTPQNLALASTASYIYNYNSNWGGNINFSAPRIHLRETTFGGTSTIEKTGASDDVCYGGNTFTGNATITNSGSRYLLMGYSAGDIFQSDLTVNNSGSHYFYLAYSTAGNQIAGNLTVNNSSTGPSSGMRVCSGGSSVLNISGNTTINNSSTANTSSINFGESGDITNGGNLNVVNAATGTNGEIRVASNTSSSVTISGNSTFSNSGANTTKRIYAGNSGDITFTGTVDINNSSTATYSEIFLNHSTNGNNTYNGNIIVSSTGATSDGIFFGNGGGQSTLASGKTITVGGAGFSNGYLFLRNFTQLGSTAQNFTLSNTAIWSTYNSTFNGTVDFKAPRVLLRGTTFNGTTLIEKTGATNDASTGGNIFNGETTLKNSGTSYFMPSNGSANDFNGNVTYVKSNTGLLYPSYNAKSTYAGNLTINANSVVRFASAGNGEIILDGSATQSINKGASTPTPEFRTLTTSKPSNHTVLNTPIAITYRLNMTKGNFNTTSTNTIYINDNATARTPSNDSYVDGPVVKIGNDDFIFPVGGGGFYAPIEMTRPSSSSSRFEASYTHASAHSNGYDTTLMESGLDHISSNEYWNLDRLNGSNNVKVKLHWNSSRSGSIASGSICNLRVAHWNGAKWTNEGNGGATGNAVDGSFYTGLSENCSNTTSVTSWAQNQPFTIAVDSNYITWDGTAYDGGSGTGSAPSNADAGRILKVYAPNAVLPVDAKVAHVIITPTGKLSIPSGTILDVSGTITNNGEITLENNSSLLQTIAGTDQNKGTGLYTVKRTGNSSAYSYNIWSSPIKNAALSTVFSSSNACDIWAFDENNQAWSHDYSVGYSTSCYGNAVTFSATDVISGGDGNMDIARGYFVPGAVITSRAFKGEVNNGDITMPIKTTSLGNQTHWDDDDWNLVGNPYPSALDASLFLAENAVDNERIDGAIYFWDAGDTTGGYNQHSDYGTFNGLGGVNSGNTSNIPAGQIASGQGFWVYAKTNTDLVYTNAMRTGANSQFFKQDPVVNHNVWVSFTTPNNYTNNILLGFNENSTDLEDQGLDAHKLEGSANVRFSSLINTDEFAIQAFEELSIGDSKAIPVFAFSADSGIHTFSKYHSENIPDDITVYIKDNVNGTIHNFDDGDYQVDLDAQVNYDSRFEIVFEKTIEIASGGTGSKGSGNSATDSIDVVTGINTVGTESQFVLATTTTGYTLSNESGFSGVIVLIDVTGKVVWSNNQEEQINSFNIPTNELSQGIYFIEVIENDQRIYSNKILKQ